MKRIYFGCSIAGGRDYSDMYHEIAEIIKDANARLFTELFVDKNLKEKVGTNPELVSNNIWQRDTSWVKEAHALIAEVTQPSLGVGYEIAVAEQSNIPVLALFYEPSGRRLSPMVEGNPAVSIVRYGKVGQLRAPIREFIGSL